MREHELELIRLIRDIKDPTNAITIAVDVIRSVLSGESEASIMESYGVTVEERIRDAS